MTLKAMMMKIGKLKILLNYSFFAISLLSIKVDIADLH